MLQGMLGKHGLPKQRAEVPSCDVTDMRNALFSSVGHAIHLAGQRLVVHYWTLLRCYTCASEYQGTQNIKQNNNNMQI